MVRRFACSTNWWTLVLCAHMIRKCFDRFRSSQNIFGCDPLQNLFFLGGGGVAGFWAFLDGEICFTFINVFCGLRGLYPPKYTLPKSWKFCRRDAIRLRLVKTDAWHCLDYFERVADPGASLPLFFLCAAPNCFSLLCQRFSSSNCDSADRFQSSENWVFFSALCKNVDSCHKISFCCRVSRNLVHCG